MAYGLKASICDPLSGVTLSAATQNKTFEEILRKAKKEERKKSSNIVRAITKEDVRV